MLMINAENSFFDIFSYFLQVLPPQKCIGDEIFPFFSSGTFFNIVSNKDFKKVSSKC